MSTSVPEPNRGRGTPWKKKTSFQENLYLKPEHEQETGESLEDGCDAPCQQGEAAREGGKPVLRLQYETLNAAKRLTPTPGWSPCEEV